MRYDLIIRNGSVVSPNDTTRYDVAVFNGRIESLLPPGAAADSAETVDASGMLLLPGLVDAHVHLREPGITHKEGFSSGTKAAAAGGVTTVMVMPTDDPFTMTPDDFAAKRELAEGQVYVDFALQAGLGSDTSSIRSLLKVGAISFETFLADVHPNLLVSDAETLLNILSYAASEGAVVGVTPGDHDIISRRTQKIRSASQGALADFPPSRPGVSESLGVARACIAASETGARVHLRQVSTGAAANLIHAFDEFENITSEVTPHNLVLDESELFKRGPFAKVVPPLRPRADVISMRDALRNRIIDIVATDHAPHLPSEKQKGSNNIWDAPGGLPGLQTMLPAMLSLVDDNALSLNDLVRVCCSRPAHIFGIAGRKGEIKPKADADIVILDPSLTNVVEVHSQYSKAKETPFEGLKYSGKIRSVLLRGKEIVSDGVVLDLNPCGQFIHP